MNLDGVIEESVSNLPNLRNIGDGIHICIGETIKVAEISVTPSNFN